MPQVTTIRKLTRNMLDDWDRWGSVFPEYNSDGSMNSYPTSLYNTWDHTTYNHDPNSGAGTYNQTDPFTNPLQSNSPLAIYDRPVISQYDVVPGRSRTYVDQHYIDFYGGTTARARSSVQP